MADNAMEQEVAPLLHRLQRLALRLDDTAFWYPADFVQYQRLAAQVRKLAEAEQRAVESRIAPPPSPTPPPFKVPAGRFGLSRAV